MTRRERHLRIIANMGEDRLTPAIRRMLSADDRFINFTDDAIEKLASSLVRNWKLEHELNAKNRLIRELAR